MRRWVGWIAVVLALVLIAWGGYEAYRSFVGLEYRLARLEAQVEAQRQALEALGSRVGRLEEEVFRAPTQEAPPEVPAPVSAPAPAWPYALGLGVLLLILYLALRLFRGGKAKEAQAPSPEAPQAPSPEAPKPQEEALAESKMLDEGAPPSPEEGRS